MTTGEQHSKTKALMRDHALISGLGALFSGLIYFAVDFPLPVILAKVAFLAAACYFAYYLFFDRISRTCYAEAGVALSVMGVAALTVVVHFSGGIVSPFIFFYFTILICETLYGFQNPFTLPLALTGYLAVVGGEYFGFLRSANPWALEFYASPAATFLLAAVTTGNLALSRRITRLIILNLRGKIEREGAEKENLLRKFSELNSTMQLGVLAHRIAHDLRGPIACIAGYIELELKKVKNAEDKGQLAELDETVRNMQEALHGITRFGKAAGPTCEKISLKDFVHDLLAIISFSPQARGIKFNAVYPEANDIAVDASRADLQQAYFNIIKNAVEAVNGNPDGRTIDISIERRGKDVEISISDDGPGIPADILAVVLRKSVTTKKDGTGVGLLITRDLLIRNSGDIKLRNREGGGLTVVTTLPAA